jgi:hypothetical protein
VAYAYIYSNGTTSTFQNISMVSRVGAGVYLIMLTTGLVSKGLAWVSGEGYSMRITSGVAAGFPTYDYCVISQGGGNAPSNQDHPFSFFLM